MADQICDRTSLILKTGGKLEAVYSIYYPKTREFTKREIDYAEDQRATLVTFEELTFDPELKLGDIFLLLKKNPTLFEMFPYAQEYTNEALEADKTTSEEVEYLEFYYKIYEDNAIFQPGKKLFHFHPQIVGHGTKDERKTEFCLQYLNPGQYYNCPIRLNKNLIIENTYGITYESNGAVFTLGSILYGLFKELSFHGSPEDRDKFSEMLRKRSEDSKNA